MLKEQEGQTASAGAADGAGGGIKSEPPLIKDEPHTPGGLPGGNGGAGGPNAEPNGDVQHNQQNGIDSKDARKFHSFQCLFLYLG